MKIRILTSMAGPAISLSPGDIYECGKDEARRLIDVGFAVPFTGDPAEKAIRAPAPETRKRAKPKPKAKPKAGSET